MTNEELNTALYEKMFSEQETYRAWLQKHTGKRSSSDLTENALADLVAKLLFPA